MEKNPSNGREFLCALRQSIQKEKNWPRKPDYSLEIEPKPHGWLFPTLILAESNCWGRWSHWLRTMEAGKLLDDPIPRIQFDPHNAAPARKMHENALTHITKHGSWQGWGSWDNFNYYLDWQLYAFGHSGQKELPKEPEEGAFARLYQSYCLEAAIAYPADIYGDMLAENAHGKKSGFYPTPHHVVEMMTQITMGTEDMRDKTVCDPCLGTGRMLLHASNYSYRLYGQDIDGTVIKAALVNGYCFAPWLVKPFSFLDQQLNDPEKSAELSDSITEDTARSDIESYLQNTEHDTVEQYRFEPIKKRKRNNEQNIEQGWLL